VLEEKLETNTLTHDCTLPTQVRYGYFSINHDQSNGSCIVFTILSMSQSFLLLQAVNSLARADHSSREVLPSVCACVIQCDQGQQ